MIVYFSLLIEIVFVIASKIDLINWFVFQELKFPNHIFKAKVIYTENNMSPPPNRIQSKTLETQFSFIAYRSVFDTKVHTSVNNSSNSCQTLAWSIWRFATPMDHVFRHFLYTHNTHSTHTRLHCLHNRLI